MDTNGPNIPNSEADELEEIAEHRASLPVLDARRAEQILGYGESGLPS